VLEAPGALSRDDDAIIQDFLRRNHHVHGVPEPLDIELAVGTVDEEFLVGERKDDDTTSGGFGVVLANPNADHFWVRNEIRGVTDGLGKDGTRFWKGSKEGALVKVGN